MAYKILIHNKSKITSGGFMVLTRKMVLMALHSHLIKTENFYWANAVLRYLHGFKIDKTEIWVINLALRMVSFDQFQIPKEF